jgi:hypothetical protein
MVLLSMIGDRTIPPDPRGLKATFFRPKPTLFMNASAAIADSLLRQACMRFPHVQAGGLTAQTLNILFQVCFGSSRLHAPVSRRDYAIS